MPNYKGHLVGGTLAFVLMVYIVRDTHPSALTLLEWLAWTLLGSLFPDVDIRSKGRKIFYRFLILGLFYFLIQNKMNSVVFLSGIGLIPKLVRHRGLFHRVWFIVLCCLVPVWYVKTYNAIYTVPVVWSALFFCVGALSHVLLDYAPIKMKKRW